jgi:Flp pilus assembly protein TadG
MRILLIALRSTSIVRRVGVDESGAALVEFALVAPLLILLMAGTVIFTWAFINYATLSYAAGTGAQVITTERLNITSTNWTPYADTVNAVKSASSILDPTALGIVVTVNSVQCSSEATCQSKLTAVTNTTTQASVQVTYPCDPIAKANPFMVMWLNLGSCSFTTTITGVVQ